MRNQYYRLMKLPIEEFEAEVAKMAPEEVHAFILWLRHEDDQRYAKVVRAEERAELSHTTLEMLQSHGFGTPGKETLRDVLPLLSEEEQRQVAQVVFETVEDFGKFG
jgi:hypothetical protein